MASYLSHHGVKGMKWGQHLPHVITSLRESSNAFRGGANIANQSASRKQQRAMDRTGKDVSRMTDQQLREAVNRLNLERQYKSLKAEDIGAGKRYVNSILSTAGEVAAVGASAASIALAIWTIRNKQ